MQIETERLILREMNEEDFDDLYCVLAVRILCSIIRILLMKKESVDGLKKIRNGTRFLVLDCGLCA